MHHVYDGSGQESLIKTLNEHFGYVYALGLETHT